MSKEFWKPLKHWKASGMGRRPICRNPKCRKWFGDKPWIYIFERRYFCSKKCLIQYQQEEKPKKKIAFRVRQLPGWTPEEIIELYFPTKPKE
jgi:hypothetical protein